VAKSGAGALLVGGGQFFNSRRNQLVGLAALHAIPTSYAFSGTIASGGLVSYGASQTDVYRRAGARPDSQGREARRSPGRASDEV